MFKTPRIARVIVSMPLLLLLCVDQHEAAQPSVNLTSSVVFGFSSQVGPTRVDKYLGIRFGQPPTGPLRFAKPQPATLDAVVNATRYGNPCASVVEEDGMSEDCLFLDVYVPHNSGGTGKGLPVMMWIYGGGFTYGFNAEYDGKTLAAEGNVIVVAPNYRLGPFGFLSTGDDSCRGNMGLWDQWLALKWIRTNIEKFGGDVANITLIGESAGAASTNYFMTSPYSVNWFRRAILQSGCRLCHWAYNASYHPLDKANHMAQNVNCSTATKNDTESTKSLIACLRTRSAEAILVGSVLWDSSMWSPVIDGDFVLPYNEAPKFRGSVMAGLNNREGGYGLNIRKISGKPLNKRSYHHNTFIPILLRGIYPSLSTSASANDVQRVVKAVDDMYKVPGLSNDSYVPDEELEAILGDTDLFICNKQLFDSHPTTGNAYLYYFDHYPKIPSGEKGMNHGMDLHYTFGFHGGMIPDIFSNITITDKDLTLARNFRSFLTNFAQSGDPYKPKPLPADWPKSPLYKDDESYLAVSPSPAVCKNLRKNRVSFWLQVVPSLLRSEDPVSYDKTRFRHCVRPTGAAVSVDVTKTVYAMCSFILLSILI